MTQEIEYVIVADRVILEKETNKASIIGIFQGVLIPKEIPSIALPLTVFARVKNVSGQVEAKVAIVDPEGVEVQSVLLKGPVEKTLQISAQFSLFNFDKIGKYKILISVNENELKSREEHSIEVKKQQ